MDFSGAILAPPRGKLANYITLELPNANVTNGNAEETEIETGISLPQLQGIRWLGVEFSGIMSLVYDAGILAAADVVRKMDVAFASRTGDFNLDDPEYIEGYAWAVAIQAAAGPVGEWALEGMEHTTVPAGGDVVVTPRIFVRLGNNIGVTISAGGFQVRAGYEFERIQRNKFIELLERFADIFVI